ncbi:catalase-domain-containing protein [Macrolepiota fuliginosa MF-IS2]|uniref:Catalase-domain-containing protein n=1 Tax=Macrolepiota fuliginosa MF-IS2 TaxID=1400762 RepID=A0A9P5XKL3_9AGAR|nr:catalase-domain-containing protein [Macrolepiota fuliginosa MF-IS2]
MLAPTFVLLLAQLAFADGNFNMYQGPITQVQHVGDPASSLTFTLTGGQPFWNPYMVDRLGTTGPLLLQSTNMIEQLAHFVRERVPERQVHAKAAGAHGYFEVTTLNGAKLSMADVFSEVGKRTPLTARLSTIAGNSGNADSVRDLRGLAFKLRTQQGILDWVFLNHPVFWLRDPVKFPHFIHTQKRHPATHVTNFNDFWDYLSANNESIHQVMRTFTDLGTPYGFRHMNGHAGNTFRAVAADGSWNYIKISAISDQGIKNNTQEEATKVAGESPDFGLTDLWDAIEAGDFPSWTVYFQAMNATQAEKFKYNIFDLTKEWLPEDVPLIEIGRITLNQNVANYHQEVEQVSYDPGQMPPGLEPTEDPTLQARLFAYADAARSRIGVNYKQLPINCPLNLIATFTRDGAMSFYNQGSRPEFASTQDALKLTPRPYNDDNHTIWVGGAVKFVSTPSEIDFDQARGFWGRLSVTDQEHFISNVVGHLGLATNADIRQKQARIFAHVNATLGQRIAEGVKVSL